MKRWTLLVVLALVTGTGGCSFSAGTIGTPTPTQLVDGVGTIVAATMQAVTPPPSESLPTQASTEEVPTEAATQTGGTPISYEGVSFVIPNGVAASATTEKMTAVEANSGAPWEIAPTHLRITLTEYQLQGKFHQPQVYIYPADEYIRMNSNAAFQIESIKKIRAGAPILKETMPRVPWFNADLMIAANIKIIPFQNGQGVRTLTEYAQYYAPINNNELVYHFQGLTNDDKYYIFAILPITAPILPENEKPDAPVPEGGIPIPTDIGVNNTYYFSVTEMLNSLSPDAFTPSLEALDALIQSILVN
jgi:hypothetical protein